MIQAGCCYHGPVPYTQVIQFLHFKIFCLLVFMAFLSVLLFLCQMYFCLSFLVPVIVTHFLFCFSCLTVPVCSAGSHDTCLYLSSPLTSHYVCRSSLCSRILDSFTSYRQKQGFVNQKQECQTHFTSHATYSTLCS